MKLCKVLCECKSLNRELSPGPLRSKNPPVTKTLNRTENPSHSSGGLSLLCETMCICVLVCVNVFWSQMTKGEFEHGMKPERSTKNEWQRDGDKTFWRREEGLSLWSVCFLKEEEQNHRSKTKRKRERTRERESEGDGAKQGERLEQIGRGIFRSNRSGWKCWRRRGKVGKRENWESGGTRKRVGEKGGIWGISKWKEKVFLLMRLKFSISLHLLQTVRLWEQHPSRVWRSLCVVFLCVWLRELGGFEYNKCGWSLKSVCEWANVPQN